MPHFPAEVGTRSRTSRQKKQDVCVMPRSPADPRARSRYWLDMAHNGDVVFYGMCNYDTKSHGSRSPGEVPGKPWGWMEELRPFSEFAQRLCCSVWALPPVFGYPGDVADAGGCADDSIRDRSVLEG